MWYKNKGQTNKPQMKIETKRFNYIINVIDTGMTLMK